MSTRCVSAHSRERSTAEAVAQVVDQLATGLANRPADLIVAFASAQHAAGLATIAQRVRDLGLGSRLIGGTGEWLVQDEVEVEGEPALSLWAAQFGEGCRVSTRRAGAGETGVENWAPEGSQLPKPSLVLAIGDPFSFPADEWLAGMKTTFPGVPVVGGMASAGRQPGGNRLVVDHEVHRDGAVIALIEGPVGVRTVVSQGCRPVGRPMIVTKADRNIIQELGRRPALEAFQEMFQSLDAHEQARARHGLHLGRVINEYQEDFRRGDFLVRNVLGVDDRGGLVVTDLVRVGQTVQFHVRDAESADEDLQALLDPLAGARRAVGALLFTCNGRGTRLFPAPNHDAEAVRDRLGSIPVAGFFAMGEIGPVGGQNFVHGFTASVAVFEEDAARAGEA